MKIKATHWKFLLNFLLCFFENWSQDLTEPTPSILENKFELLNEQKLKWLFFTFIHNLKNIKTNKIVQSSANQSISNMSFSHYGILSIH